MKKKQFGKNLQGLREAAGISQEEFAERLNISVTSVSNLERGKNYPSFENFIRILDVLNAQSDSLLFGVCDSAYIAEANALAKKLEGLSQFERYCITSTADTMVKIFTDEQNNISKNRSFT